MQGSADNPVVNVTVRGAILTVHYADGTTADRALPAGTGTGGPAVDQTARDAAARALAAIPDKASNADVDGESDDSDYVTVLKVFRAIARKVKAATTSAAGIVTLARNEDVDASESDTSRVPDVSKVKRLVERIVPSWARASDPPEPDVLHVTGADTIHSRPNTILLRNVPDPEVGRRYGFFVEMANTDAVTLAVGSTAARPLQTATGEALAGGELVVGEFIELVTTGNAFRIIGGPHGAALPAASESARGGVVLARAEDVADSETDLSRVPTLTRAIALIRRLLSENVRSIPEPEASHVGRPLVATSEDHPYVGYQRLGTDGYDDDSVTEAKLDSAARTKLNARTTATDATAREAVMAEATARERADAALGVRIDGKQEALTPGQLVDLLQFDTVPGVIVGYTTAGQAADWLTDWRVWVSGGSTVGDVWMELQIEGLSTLAAPAPSTPGASLHRHKLTAANIYNYTFSNRNRNNLISSRTSRRQGRDIEIDLRFYDAASGGNVIDIKTLAVDWLPSPASVPASWSLLATEPTEPDARRIFQASDAEANAIVAFLTNGKAGRALLIEATKGNDVVQGRVEIVADLPAAVSIRDFAFAFSGESTIIEPSITSSGGDGTLLAKLNVIRRASEPHAVQLTTDQSSDGFTTGTALKLYGLGA